MKNLALSNLNPTKSPSHVHEIVGEEIKVESVPIPTCEKVKEFRGNLIASVAHDLRTPLQSILGYSETILDKKDQLTAEQQNQYLEIVVNSANKLSSMIEQFFEYSKLEVNAVIPSKTPFSPIRIMKDLRQNYKVIASTKNVSIDFLSDENLHKIFGDYSMIYRVFQNIIDNALKFTSAGGQIIVSFENCDEEKLKVQISDTGVGISKEDLHSVFNKFKMTDSCPNCKKSNDGIGLGLAIVKTILDQHDSSIYVKSELGVGTTFTFYLPTAY